MEESKQKNDSGSKSETGNKNYDHSSFGDHIENRKSIIPSFEWPKPGDDSDDD